MENNLKDLFSHNSKDKSIKLKFNFYNHNGIKKSHFNKIINEQFDLFIWKI